MCVYLGVCIIHEVKYVHISLVSTGVHAVSAYPFVSVAPWEGALYLYGMYRSIYFKKPTSPTIYFLSSTPTLKK